MTVACVLRSGGDFDASWVHALNAGVNEYLSVPHRFVCLSDVEISGVNTIPLAHDWPRWWPKVELFRPGQFDGPVLYMDLDSLPVGPLDEIAAYPGLFAMLADFYLAERGRKVGESGVMAWIPDKATEALYEIFAADPTRHMRLNRDGRFIREHALHEFLQDMYPGQIVSLKAHARNAIPDNARLVCGHGRPRFSDPAAGWAHQLWKERVAA